MTVGARNRDELERDKGCKLPLLVNDPIEILLDAGGSRVEASKVSALTFDKLGGSWFLAEDLGEVEPCQVIRSTLSTGEADD